AAAAALVAVLAAAVLIRRDDRSEVVPSGPPASGAVEIPVGTKWGVRGLAVTDDAVWVTSQFDEQLYRGDPSSNSGIATYPIPSHVEGVKEAGGSLWLSRYEPNELLRVDPTTGSTTARLSFDSQPNLVTDGARLWVVAQREGTNQAVEVD